MSDRQLAAQLLKGHHTAAAALIALMLKNLPDDVRTRTLDAVRNGTGKVELRTRVNSNETELVPWLRRVRVLRIVRRHGFGNQR